MKKITLILLVACLCVEAGCSRPTAEAPATAQSTPPPQKSEQGEQVLKADSVKEHAMKAEPMNDKPVVAVSPSPSASGPKP